MCYAYFDKKEEIMGRTTAEENKSEWIRFRIKPSLRRKILKLQANDFEHQHLALQDFVVVILCRGLRVEEQLAEWNNTALSNLVAKTAEEERNAESKGGLPEGANLTFSPRFRVIDFEDWKSQHL
jgi:hypothetical protein